MTLDENKQLALAVIERMSAGDPSFADLIAEDGSYTVIGPPQFLWGGTRSREEVRKGATEFFRIVPGMRMTAKTVIAEGDTVAIEAQSHALPPGGRPYEIRYVFLFRVRDGKIQTIHEYCDTLYAQEYFTPPAADGAVTAARNRQIIESAYAEIARGNERAFPALFADDVRVTLIGSTKYSGTFAGKKTVIENLLKPLATELRDGLRLELVNVVAEGDYVVTEARGEATTTGGKPYRNTYCQVFRMAGGKVTELVEYLDTELVNESFGRLG